MKNSRSNKCRETLVFIEGFIKMNGYPPSVAELADHFGIQPTAANGRLETLENKGFIKCGKDGNGRRKTRAIQIIPNAFEPKEK